MKHLVLGLAAASVLLTGSVVAKPRDFTGVWMRYPNPYDVAAGDGDARFIDVVPPPGGAFSLKEPYATAHEADLKRRRAAAERHEPLGDESTRCSPEGMPTMMQAIYDLQILHAPNEVVVLAEEYGQIRRIYLDEKMPPLEEIRPTYNGRSVGHWEGDTLVVETRGVREDVTFAPWGIPHSPNMKITERLRSTGPDLLEIRFTIEDPEVLNKPYVFTWTYKKDPIHLDEYICENKRDFVDKDGKLNVELGIDARP